jgi:predicted acyl esterase
MATKYGDVEIAFVDACRTMQNMWMQFGLEKRVLRKGWQKEPGTRPIPVDLIWEKDVSIKMRDDVTLYGDVFRPVDSDEHPVPALMPWSPYGKTGTGRFHHLMIMLEPPAKSVPQVSKTSVCSPIVWAFPWTLQVDWRNGKRTTLQSGWQEATQQ